MNYAGKSTSNYNALNMEGNARDNNNQIAAKEHAQRHASPMRPDYSSAPIPPPPRLSMYAVLIRTLERIT